MKNLSLIFATIIFSFVSAYAQQDPSVQVKSKIAVLKIMSGKWEGSGWQMEQSGERKNVQVKEQIQFRLDSTILMVEGLGTDANGNTVHEAMGIISYDPYQNKYVMNSFVSQGYSTKADFEVVSDTAFIWSFSAGPGKKIRYKLTFENDTWNEKGEISINGGEWFPFFEMKLTRITN